ncbi:MAG: hypothetical protein ACFB2W_22250 [Leptolyngbyaceae cyanobacterium]
MTLAEAQPIAEGSSSSTASTSPSAPAPASQPTSTPDYDEIPF